MPNIHQRTSIIVIAATLFASPLFGQQPALEKQVLVGGSGKNLPPCPRFDLSFQSAMMFRGSAYSVEIIKREEGIDHIGKGGPKPRDELMAAYIISPTDPDPRFSQTCEIHIEIKHVFGPAAEN